MKVIPGLRDWNLVIISDLAGRGISSKPGEPDEQVALRQKLAKALLTYTTSPSPEALELFLPGLPPG